MDLNPTNTPNNVLVSALNATLITKNGNEGALQNDMGNGRVETAFLPTGYIPVGVCEFGDIIYITSYNPLEDKCQIGCFPSPERNISTDELDDKTYPITSNDFQELNNEEPTGKLLQTSKIIQLGDIKLNPGDKYLISFDTDVVKTFEIEGISHSSTLTDLFNDAHKVGTFPKFIRINIVCVDENSKIINLDSSLKWFQPNDYYINYNESPAGVKPNVDAYRNLLSEGYAVFASKYPGKLALKIDLEMPTTFTCTVSGIDITKRQ